MQDIPDLGVRVYAPESQPAARLVMIHGLAESRDSFNYLGAGLADEGVQLVTVDVRGMLQLQRLDRLANAEEANRRLVAAVALVRDNDPDTPIWIGGNCAGGSHCSAALGATLDDSDIQLRQLEGVDGLVLLGPQPPQLQGIGQEFYDTVQVPNLYVAYGSEDFNFIRVPTRPTEEDLKLAHTRVMATRKYLLRLDNGWHNAFTDSEPYPYPEPRPFERVPSHHPEIVSSLGGFILDSIDLAAQGLRCGLSPA